MRKIAKTVLWLYPLLFLLDGAFSVIDDATAFFIPLKLMSTLRNSFAYIVLFMTVPFIFSLFFFKTKKSWVYLILPLYSLAGVAAASWNAVRLVEETSLFSMFALSLSPHWIFTKHPSFFAFQLTCSLIQVIVVAYSFNFAWKNRMLVEDRPLKYLKGAFTGFMFGFTYVLISTISILFLFKGAAKGFLGFSEGNVTSIEKVYQKEGKIIHLIPMVHIGAETFYKEISVMNATRKTLVLMEGVSDLKDLLEPISYKKFAESAGLESQADHFKPQTAKEFKDNLSFLVADVDASEFTPETRKFLNTTMKDLGKKSFFDLLVGGKEEKPTSGQMSNFAVDVLERRNKKLMIDLRANQHKFEEFYIPWGALHLPEIEREILKDGYIQISIKERPVISLGKIVNKISDKKQI
jgi:hypothetical protein